MPVSHITLTVSHLPTSTSFFLSCLQPLGYRFIGRHDNNVGFGSVPGEPADFWIAEERPGVPAGAAHIAFPAPSRDAVGAFFIAALKAGGKIHGEPTLRDAEQNYYSAAVIDIDGNSIEAVHRPGNSAEDKSPVERALTVIKNGSVVSRASSTKTESVVRQKSEIGTYVSKARTTVSRPAAASASPQTKAPASVQLQQPPVSQPKESTNGAKAVVGTLLGAAAGAAIAYSIFKSDSPSDPIPAPQYVEHSAPASAPIPEPTLYRAIEAAPQSSVGGNDNIYADYARTMLSKNPRASTIMEGIENCSRIWGQTQSVRGGMSEYGFQDVGRRASSASIYSGMDRDMPIRAIEACPIDEEGSECSYSYPHNQPSTFISSFKDRPRYNDSQSTYSSSTIKPSSKTHSSHSRPASSHHSQHSSRSVITIKDIHSCTGSSKSATPTASIYSSTHSARNIPLPSGTVTTISTSTSSSRRHHHSAHSSHSHSHSSSPKESTSPPRSHHSHASSKHSHRSHADSARHVPLPSSVAGASTIFLDVVDVDSHVTPVAGSRAGSRRSTASKTSRRSSKFDEPVKPSDSVSQVSTNVSKRSSRR
ncbi:hypothetical protein FQN55_000212 [Onygenales sp. PD_40]|nr:hypothetical protein FQN55_000212 [Onygenales sp. PD_40]KAK2790776.1 hypothetical protein FQN53_008599 [Emmonsiellopsis sp. PD_33]KAK2792213.1 hypothetical protein FQN51_001872 [Onygenales sp. PD_10]KAK2792440.1 hypothetical protein FQN52_003375 [Onygenales sp. PD_12]